MGGCLTLLAMASGETRFAGAVLSAPMLGLHTGALTARPSGCPDGLPPSAAPAPIRWARPASPSTTFEGNVLTHDRGRFARTGAQVRANPDLALGGPTWGWLDFAFRAVPGSPAPAARIDHPRDHRSREEESLVDNAAQAARPRHLPQGRLSTSPAPSTKS